MKTKCCGLFLLVALWAGVQNGLAHEAQFFRVSGPTAVTITAFHPDGTLVFSNAEPGATYTVQTVSALPGGTNWMDYVQIPVTNSVTFTTNTFLYDGWNLIAEVGTSGSLVRSYVWGTDLSGSLQGAGGVGGLLEVSYHGTATTNAFVAYDGNGNVTALINAGDGTLLANYDYGPFGEVIRLTGPLAQSNPLRFSTKYQDDESDLLYYGYRYYKPKTGTWLNRDPFDERGGIDLYAFVNNNGLSKIDSFGLCTVGSKMCDCKVRITPYGISPTTEDAVAAMEGAYQAADLAGAASEGIGVGACEVEGTIASTASGTIKHTLGGGSLPGQAIGVVKHSGDGKFSAWTLFTYVECQSRCCINPMRLLFGSTYWGKPVEDDPPWKKVSVDSHDTDFSYPDGFASPHSASVAGHAQCDKLINAFEAKNPPPSS